MKEYGRNCCRIFFLMLMFMIDYFDRLFDLLLFVIFNKLVDIKVLGRCCVVLKRFYFLVLLVDNVVVKVDCVIFGEDNGLNVRGRGIISYFVCFVVGILVKFL